MSKLESGPQRYPVLIPEHRRVLTYTVKGLADVITLRILRWETPWVSEVGLMQARVLIPGRQREMWLEKAVVLKVSTVRGGLWRWRQGLTAKEYGDLEELESRKETDSPLEPPGGVKACWHLELSQQNQLQTSDLRDCEDINNTFVLFLVTKFW